MSIESKAELVPATDIATPIDQEKVQAQIYTIRGTRVMLDRDIAEYFQVTTGNLNKAMKRNIKRFPENFCFQLTQEECSRFQIGSLNGTRGSNIKYRPFCYSEQGIAMLTSVLHTDRVIAASIQIMEAFVAMRHYIQENRMLIGSDTILRLEQRQAKTEQDINDIKENMVTRADLSDFMKLFDRGIKEEEILILDGQPFKADIAYQKIYGKAKKNMIYIDDYLGIKTLQHMAHTRAGVKITIVSDNKGKKPLRLTEYNDYLTEYPGRTIDFISAGNRIHDRYIILDYGTKSMIVYHCGASSKDAGKKITTITKIADPCGYKDTIKSLLAGQTLTLK